jgi:predicted PurR-regulated permease PerM
VLIAAVLLSLGTVFTVRSLIPAVLLGAWLAAITEPLSARIARRVGGRSRAASMLTLMLLLSLGGLAAALVLPIVSDVTSAARTLRTLLMSGAAPDAMAQAFATPPLATSTHAPLLTLARELAPFAEAALTAMASMAMQMFVFLVTAYYLVIDGRRLEAGLERVSPFGAENTRIFIREFVAVGRGIALSMGVTGLVTALVLGGAFALVGVPRPMLLAAVAFAAAMLPTGAHIVWVPVAALLAWQGRHTGAAIVSVVGVVGVGGVIDHVLRPWLVRFGRLELHPLLTILGLCGGVAAFGPWGVFLGPLLIALTATALRLSAARPILARRSLVPGERVTVVSAPPATAVPPPIVPPPPDKTVH